MIFNYITQKDTIHLRLVCKQWNREVGNYYQFNIRNLDEQSTNFRSILQLHIKEVKILRFKTTTLFDRLGPWLLKYPSFVQKFIIPSHAEMLRLNLLFIIGEFSKNLRVFEINIKIQMYNNVYPYNFNFNFKSLKSLCIQSISTTAPPTSEKCLENPTSLFKVLQNSTFPGLEQLKVVLLKFSMTRYTKGRFLGNFLRL